MEVATYKNTTASVAVKSGYGKVRGIVIASHASGTIKLWDNTTASTTILVNTMTLAVGERWIPLFDAVFNVGLFVTIGGTADITVVYY